MTRTTYEPHAGPITLDTLDDLLASRRAIFAGFEMMADDEEEVDDPGDEGDDDADDDGDEDDDDPDEGKTPEEIKAELKKTREALTRANAEAKKRRLREKERQKPASKKKRDADDEDDDDDEKVSKVEARWKARVVNAGARAALAEAGAEKPERLLRLLDTDTLDVDDDGEIDGLDDEIDRLREEYPELFEKKGRGTGKRRVETGDRSGGRSSARPKTATEKQAAAILGRSR